MVHPPPAKRDHVRVDDGGHGHEPAAAEAGEGAGDDDPDHVISVFGRGRLDEPAPKTAKRESDGAYKETDAAPKDIGDAPIERLEGGARDQVGGGQPRGGVGGAELRGDDGVGGGGDGAVEAVEEDVGHEGDLDEDEVRGRGPGIVRRGGVAGRLRRGRRAGAGRAGKEGLILVRNGDGVMLGVISYTRRNGSVGEMAVGFDDLMVLDGLEGHCAF